MDGRFAVSTLGAPGRPVAETARLARAAGARALELRAGPGEPADRAADPASHERLRDLLDRERMTVLAVASYVRVAQEGPDEPVLADLDAHLQVAARLGAPYLRVFPGGPGSAPSRVLAPEPDPRSDERAARRLAAAAATARSLGVSLALETHDSHPRGEDVARVLGLLPEDAPVSVVWDLLHPWRVGEPIELTWEYLRPWLATGRGWTQIKDVRSPADPLPVPPGLGVLPLRRALSLLRSGGFDGWVSLEWEKAWHPEAAALSVALTESRSLLDSLD